MESWETLIALLLLSPFILTILSFFAISIIEAIREARRGVSMPHEGEMLPEYLEELLRRRR